jgi:NADH-quinone oxidoreductase subunit F
MSTPTLRIMDATQGNGRQAARRVIVCAGTGCVANGAYKVFQAFVDQVQAAGLDATTEFKAEDAGHDLRLNKSGCQGFCQMGPLVTVLPEGILYNKVKVEDVAEIVATTLVAGQEVPRLLYLDPATRKHCRGTESIPFYQRQQRFVLRDCGTIDPESIHEYLHHGGYAAARKAFTAMAPEEICQELLKSGLRGRGGGGFPTGRKWEAARAQPGPKKYVICNADEGDPGAFMNRSVMEGNPHSVLEGLLIAARAIGADETFIYVRAEYPLAVQRMRRAVVDAQEQGFLGDNAFGSGLPLQCEVLRSKTTTLRSGSSDLTFSQTQW